MPAGAADLVAATATGGVPIGRGQQHKRHAATGDDDAFGDRFPTQPIAVGRSRRGLVLDDDPDLLQALREAATDAAPHVSGDAVDIGESDARAWLSEHGDEYGLCQIYRNEPWHYELRPDADSDGCPAMYADPTQDPRMQQ